MQDPQQTTMVQLVARIWPGSGRSSSQGNSNLKFKMEKGVKKQEAWEHL